MPRTPVPAETRGALQASLSLIREAETNGETIFLENLQNGVSVFTMGVGSEQVKLRFEGHGFYDSVQEISYKVARHPYIRKAIGRGRVKLLTSDQATERMDELVIKEEEENLSAKRLRDAMAEGASEQTSRFVPDNLPEEAESGRSISAEEVLAGQAAGALPAPTQREVRRSGEARVLNVDPPAEVKAPEDVLTEPKKEGEWEPQTGG